MSKSYRWSSPHDWLLDTIQSKSEQELREILAQLATLLDGDQLQDLFQYDMDIDGYFDVQEASDE